MQADLQRFQVATASGAKVWELSAPARSRAQALVNDAAARACTPDVEADAAQSTAELREGSGSGGAQDVKVTVLHAACSARSVALVEFIWQVCLLIYLSCPLVPSQLLIVSVIVMLGTLRSTTWRANRDALESHHSSYCLTKSSLRIMLQQNAKHGTDHYT
jgi:hypothetical protein